MSSIGGGEELSWSLTAFLLAIGKASINRKTVLLAKELMSLRQDQSIQSVITDEEQSRKP